MSIPHHNRRHFRAPLQTNVLYLDEGFVHKARLGNISEAGLFLKCIPFVPEADHLCFIIEVPELLNAQAWSNGKIMATGDLFQSRQIFRCKGRMMRKMSRQSNIEILFGEGIGVQLEDVPRELKVAIRSYVEHYTRNIVYLLQLMKKKDSESIQCMRKLAGLLNYPEQAKLTKLKLLVEHDYQSMHHHKL